MRVHYCDHHEVPLPDGHRFPMGKYAQLRRALGREGVLSTHELHPAPLASVQELQLVHTPAYVEAFLEGRLDRRAISRIGFPYSEALVTRCLASVGGTVAAARAALEDGAGGNLAGGTHHAFADQGAGYCVFNDIAVAARVLQREGLVERVLVVDVDVHQGDGTAAIFQGDDSVFTLSLHGARNFPLRKQQSDLDVPLPDGTGDEEYLAALGPALEEALRRSRPELVFYQGGVDALATDKLGRMSLSHAGLLARDELALGRLFELGLPVAVCLGGGYAEPIEDSVRAYLGTYRVLVDLLRSSGSRR